MRSLSRLVLNSVGLHLLEHVDVLADCLLASQLLKSFGISLFFSLLDLHVKDPKLSLFLGNGVFFVVVRSKLVVNLLIFLVILWLNLNLFSNNAFDA